MIIGIICEYNPFHNGHIYHINEIKKLYPDSTIILVMSGDITERGDISIINKWDKTSIALNYNIDLVIELPFIYACNSSELFAKGAMKILNEFKVNKLIFGSELNDIDTLKLLANTQISNNYNDLVKNYLKKGMNYPTSCGRALFDLTDIFINTPNDILGLSYIKEIIINNYNIEPICIKRTNDYNSINLDNNISSATSIRNALKNNLNINKYVTEITLKYINNIKYLDDYYKYIKYKIISHNIDNIYGMNNHIKSRIYKYINSSNNIDELINNIKSKNYTYIRIKRLLIYILFDITNDNLDNFKNYIRILGFNNKGKNYLNKVKKDINLPIITNYSNGKNLLNIDNKINNILNLELPNQFCIEFKEKVRIIVDNDNNIC